MTDTNGIAHLRFEVPFDPAKVDIELFDTKSAAHEDDGPEVMVSFNDLTEKKPSMFGPAKQLLYTPFKITASSWVLPILMPKCGEKPALAEACAQEINDLSARERVLPYLPALRAVAFPR